MGNAKSITFTDTAGKSWTIAGDSARVFLGVKSVRFRLENGAGGYYVNGGSTLPAVSGAYAIDGSGNVSQIGNGAYVITGSGTEQLQTPAGTGGSSYTFTGSGWGHNVGMSQWGANAMAKAGKTYRDILTFYYTGVEVN